MKYIIIPLFRIITLPFIISFYIYFFLCYALYCLWHFDFKNLFKDFFIDSDISFSKNKPLYTHYDSFTGEEEYYYETLFDYIFNKKSE